MALLLAATLLFSSVGPEDVEFVADQAGVDPTDLAGAANTTGMDPHDYLVSVGELAPPKPVYSVWDAIKNCETPGRGWDANTGNGFYGGVQFDYESWLAAGGGRYGRTANLATREQQIEIANRWLAMTGWKSWPACSKRLGLR